MVRRNVGSLRPFIQAAISGAGLLSGIAVGTWIVFGSGVLEWGHRSGTPLGSMIVITVSIAIVLGLAWVGLTVGIVLTRKVAP